MKHTWFAATLFLAASSSFLAAQDRTVGLMVHDASRTSPGYTLLAPKHNGRTYLIDNYGQVINTWDSKYPPGQSAHLLPNGNLLRAAMVQVQGGGTGGGEGGRIEEYDWAGNLVWEFDYATQAYSLHHDIKPLPNGNVIALMVERKTREEAIAAGFKTDLLQDTYLLPDAVVEIEPIRPKGGRIVWEWHVWDHLIQNADSSKANYGTPSAHPELVDPNASGKKIPAFWNHMNSIDYNPSLDQIILSVRGNSEAWVIDHSTTKAEAAGHTGGRYGKGGDLIYRWGNPRMYGRGATADQMLFDQHDVQWIEAGRIGAGNLLVFNNGIGRPGGQASSADEWIPPVDASGNYTITAGSAYGPKQLAWTFTGTYGVRYYAEAISGAHRLPNGNTLICYGTRGVLVEVTQAKEVVWEYVNPVVKEGPLAQGQTSGVDDRGHNWNAVFKVRRYPPDYIGLAGRDLSPKGLIEGSGSSVTTAPGASKYPEVTLIPGGEYEMGDHHGFVDPAHPSDEAPLHSVWIDPLFMGTYEISNRQYVEFLNSAYSLGLIEVRNGMVYRKGADDAYCETHQMVDYSSIGWDGATFSIIDTRANHPVVGIRWHGAAAYANWLSEQQGYQPCYDLATWKCDFTKNGYRLPTEAEWEYAGRGGQYNPYRVYPWGDEANYAKANWPDSGDPYETSANPWTTPVGFFSGALRRKADFAWPGSPETYQTSDGSNAYGLYDMAGNVWEWCNDWYNGSYYSVSPYQNPPGPETATPMPDGLGYRVLRGGNWYNGDKIDPGHSRVSNRDPGYYRGPQDPNHPYYHVGFRVARSVPLLTTLSAASYAAAGAPESIVAGFGEGLASGLVVSGTSPLPTSLAGTTVEVTDANGVARSASLYFISPTQINYVVPAATAEGLAKVTAFYDGEVTAAGNLSVQRPAPALFSANADGQGVAAALAFSAASGGAQTYRLVFDGTAAVGKRTSVPIDLGDSEQQTYLLLYGTGLLGITGQATATVGGQMVPVVGPVAVGGTKGLDQVTLGPLPRSLAGRGEVDIVLTVDGKVANKVTVKIL